MELVKTDKVRGAGEKNKMEREEVCAYFSKGKASKIF